MKQKRNWIQENYTNNEMTRIISRLKKQPASTDFLALFKISQFHEFYNPNKSNSHETDFPEHSE